MKLPQQHRKLVLALSVGVASLALGILSGCQKSQPEAVVASSGEAAAPSSAATLNPVAGIDYKLLQNTLPTTAAKGKVEVIEFFGYWCPHCRQFAPQFEAWRKQAGPEMAFVMMPVAFRPEHEPLQRLFFTLHSMGLDSLHTQVFQALHDQKLPLFTDAAVTEWAKKQPGIDAAKFDQTYRSFGVEAQIKQANQLVQDFELNGIPALGVAGKYYIDGDTAKSMPRAIQIANQLAAQEAQ